MIDSELIDLPQGCGDQNLQTNTCVLHVADTDPLFERHGELRRLRERLYPDFSKAKQVTVNLREGDFMFLPAGWLHQVSSFGKHAALNFWWRVNVDM
jgi:hypothetical protein